MSDAHPCDQFVHDHGEAAADVLTSVVALILDQQDEWHKAPAPGGNLATLIDDVDTVAQILAGNCPGVPVPLTVDEYIDAYTAARKPTRWREGTPVPSDDVGYVPTIADPERTDHLMLAVAALRIYAQHTTPGGGRELPSGCARAWGLYRELAHQLYPTAGQWREIAHMADALGSALDARWTNRRAPRTTTPKPPAQSQKEAPTHQEEPDMSNPELDDVVKAVTTAWHGQDWEALRAAAQLGTRCYPDAQMPQGITWARMSSIAQAKLDAAAAEPEPVPAPEVEDVRAAVLDAAVDSGRVQIVHVTTPAPDPTPEPESVPETAPEQAQESAPTADKGKLIIVHTVENGTKLIHTAKGDGSSDVMRAQRWNWNRWQSVWVLGRTAGFAHDQRRVAAAVLHLEAAGWTVCTEIDDYDPATGKLAPAKPDTPQRRTRIIEVEYAARRAAIAAGLMPAPQEPAPVVAAPEPVAEPGQGEDQAPVAPVRRPARTAVPQSAQSLADMDPGDLIAAAAMGDPDAQAEFFRRLAATPTVPVAAAPRPRARRSPTSAPAPRAAAVAPVSAPPSAQVVAAAAPLVVERVAVAGVNVKAVATDLRKALNAQVAQQYRRTGLEISVYRRGLGLTITVSGIPSAQRAQVTAAVLASAASVPGVEVPVHA